MKRELSDEHTVKFKHYRESTIDRRAAQPERLNERGGSTYALVRDKNGRIAAIGAALCRSDEIDDHGYLVKGDAFNKELGRKISLGRALKAIEVGHDIHFGYVSDHEVSDLLEYLDARDVRS